MNVLEGITEVTSGKSDNSETERRAEIILQGIAGIFWEVLISFPIAFKKMWACSNQDNHSEWGFKEWELGNKLWWEGWSWEVLFLFFKEESKKNEKSSILRHGVTSRGTSPPATPKQFPWATSYESFRAGVSKLLPQGPNPACYVFL